MSMGTKFQDAVANVLASPYFSPPDPDEVGDEEYKRWVAEESGLRYNEAVLLRQAAQDDSITSEDGLSPRLRGVFRKALAEYEAAVKAAKGKGAVQESDE